MKTIYKYILNPVDEQTLELPKGYEILTVLNQNDSAVLYAEVDPVIKEKKEVSIRIFGTGHELTEIEGYEYLGSVATHRGNLVWHIFISQY